MYVCNLLRCGLAERYEVHLAVLFGGKSSFLRPQLDGVDVRILDLGLRSKTDPRFYRVLSRVIRDVRPAVVHTHLNALIYSVLPVVRRSVPARFHTVHSLASREGKPPLRWASRVAFRNLHFTPIGISQTIADSIRDYYGVSEVPVINNAVDTARFNTAPRERSTTRDELGLSPESFVCVSVARFHPTKNHELMIQGFARAARSDGALRMLFVGDGETQPRIEALARELDLQERVTFLGRRQDVHRIVGAADLFLSTSLWEGLPITVVEAMAAGLPVVATDVGGVGDVVVDRQTGLLVPSENEAALATAILELSEHAERHHRYAKQGTTRVRGQFDIHRAVEQHDTLYRRHLDRGSVR